MAGYEGEDFYCDVAVPGRAALAVVFDHDGVLAFEHTRPFWPVHIVVAPKRHVSSLLNLTDGELAGQLLAAVQQVAADVLDRCGAASVTTNLGAYQDSKHLHFHVHAGSPLSQR